MVVPMLVLLISDWQGLVAQRALGEYGINSIIAQSRVHRWFQMQFGEIDVWSAMFAYDDISLTPLIGESRGNIVGHCFRISVSQELQGMSLRPIIRVDNPLVCLLAIVAQDRTQMRSEPLVVHSCFALGRAEPETTLRVVPSAPADHASAPTNFLEIRIHLVYEAQTTSIVESHKRRWHPWQSMAAFHVGYHLRCLLPCSCRPGKAWTCRTTGFSLSVRLGELEATG